MKRIMVRIFGSGFIDDITKPEIVKVIISTLAGLGVTSFFQKDRILL